MIEGTGFGSIPLTSGFGSGTLLCITIGYKKEVKLTGQKVN
jgi:hypothetical protein